MEIKMISILLSKTTTTTIMVDTLITLKSSMLCKLMRIIQHFNVHKIKG